MKELVVNKKNNGKKLSNFLFENFDGLNNNTFNKAMRKKDIRINDTKISENCTIYEGDEIKIYIVDELLYKSKKIEIVYEDENMVVFNKPSGIEVVGENSLQQYAKKMYKFIEPCHRLDRNTTGVVVFAKNEKSLQILLQCFKEHKIIKHYKCIVIGIPQKEKETLEAYLFKDNKKSLVYISKTPKKGYKKIITSYVIEKKEYKKNISMLDVTLHTGRTHQIRAHLAYIGYPVLGDGKYGINEINKKFKLKTQQLCSYSIQFNFGNEKNILSYLNNKIIKLKNLPFKLN